MAVFWNSDKMLSLDLIVMKQKTFQLFLTFFTVMGKMYDTVYGEMKGNYIMKLLLYYNKHLMGNLNINYHLTLNTTFLGC